MFKLLLVLLITTPSLAQSAEKVCTSIRGNGFHIAAHLGALARVTEDLAQVEALSTSSSGAASAFLYDSIALNPILTDKDSNRCDSLWCRERMSFLIKSTPLYLEALYESKTIGREMRAFVSHIETLQSLAGGAEQTKQDQDEKKVTAEKKEVSNAAFIAMALLFQHDSLRNLIMPSYYQKIGLDPVKGRLDLWSIDFQQAKFQLNFLLNYEFPDFRVFSREGLINFDFIIDILGVAADYYRAYDEDLQQDLAYILDHCAKDSRSKVFEQIGKRSIDKQSCRSLLKATMISHIDSTPLAKSRRLNDKVGSNLEMFITTSMVKGQKTVDEFLSHRNIDDKEAYFIDLTEKNLKVGVYGEYKSLMSSVDPKLGKTDFLHKKTIILPNRSWRHALIRSLSEPGASSMKLESSSNGEQYVTLGGWIDHNTSIYLKNAHCDEVVWITKKYSAYTLVKPLVDLIVGPESEFLSKVYDPRFPSGVTQNRRKLSDAVVCTDWDKYTELDYWELLSEGYTAPVYTKNDKIYSKLQLKSKFFEPVSSCFTGEKLPGKKSYSQK